MKRAIVFLMIIGVVLMSVIAADPNQPQTNVNFTFSTENLEKFNIQFTEDAIEAMETAASTNSGVGEFTMDAPAQGATEKSIDFNLVWYLYSDGGITVDLTVNPMKTDNGDVLGWTVASTVDSTYKAGTSNTAGGQSIQAPISAEAQGTTKQIVNVAANADGKMTQSYGNVALTGTATVDNAKPDTYKSLITTTVKKI